jgi:hypothetical protein
MAEGFKIGDGFIEVSADDQTRSGLTRISETIDRWLARVEERISTGIEDAFDAGADAAEHRIALMVDRMNRMLDRIDGRNIVIDIVSRQVDQLAVDLRAIDKLLDRLDGRTVRVNFNIRGVQRMAAELKVVDDLIDRIDGRTARFDVEGHGLAELIVEMRELNRQISRADNRNVRVGVRRDGSVTKASSDFSQLWTNVARVGAYITSLTSLLGPLSVGLAWAVDYALKLGAAALTLSATLPAVAAAAGLVYLAVKDMGKGMSEALKPVQDAFKKTSDEIAKMTAQAVAPLGREFVRVNFPAIHDALIRISTAVTSVVTQVGHWLNSIEGQHAIRVITEATATAVEKLAPKMAALAIAFGQLADRAGDRAIQGLGDLLGWIADKTTEWLDGITRQDVDAAITHLKDVFADIVELVRDIASTIQWIIEHTGGIKIASDILAGIGLALAVVAGAWPAALIALFTLISNHLGLVIGGFRDLALWVDDTYSKIANNPWVKKILADLRDFSGVALQGVRDALDLLREPLQWMIDNAGRAWEQIAPLVDNFFKDPTARQGIYDIAYGLTAVVGAVAELVGGFAILVTGFAAVFNAAFAFTYLVGWIHNAIAAVADWTSSTADTLGRWIGQIGDWFGALPGVIGDWLDQAATAVSDWVAAVVDWFSQLPGRATTAASSLPGQIMGVINQMVDQVTYQIGFMIGSVVGLLLSLPARAVQAVTPIVRGVVDTVISMANQAGTATTSFVTSTVAWFAQLPGRVVNAIQALPGQVASIFMSAYTQAVAIITNLVNMVSSFLASLPGRAVSALSSFVGSVVNPAVVASARLILTLSSMVGQAISVIASLPGRAASALGSLGGRLYSAGASLIRGFIDGVRSQIGPLESLLNSISNAIPSWKGPPARDATMLEPAGRSVIRGFMRGVDAETPALRNQLAGLTDSIGALGAAIPSQRGELAGGGDTYNFGPGSILLDASKIKDIADLLAMIGGLKTTARQYGARVAPGAA